MAIWAHCSHCDKESQCDIIAKESETIYSYDGDEKSIYYYKLMKCRGCDRFFFLYEEDECLVPDLYKDADYDILKTSFPIPKTLIEKNHKARKDIHIKIDDDLERCKFANELYIEICKAINEEKNVLAVLGMRTLIDTVCLIATKYKKADRTFKQNLNALKEDGYISKHDHDYLFAVLDLGHAATHRQGRPKVDQLISCIKMIENIIEKIFLFPQYSSEFTQEVKTLT